MTQKITGEFIGYVLFSQHEEKGQRMLLFVDQFTDLADVETRKAELNRKLPAELSGVDICVGLAHFHAHDTDEEQDCSVITPKDGSAPFHWREMIDIREILELAHGIKTE